MDGGEFRKRLEATQTRHHPKPALFSPNDSGADCGKAANRRKNIESLVAAHERLWHFAFIGLVVTVSVIGVDRFMQPSAAQINSGVWKDTPPPVVAIQDPFAAANK